MSLDVRLTIRTGVKYKRWDEYDNEYVESEVTERVFDRNITHNLNKMADKAGIYEPLWRPDEIGIETASQLIEPLKKGLLALEADPAYYKTFEPDNGWGTYGSLVELVRTYLAACELNPHASVSVSR